MTNFERFNLEQIIFIRTIQDYEGHNVFRQNSLTREAIRKACGESRNNYVKDGCESYYYNMTIWPNDIGLGFLTTHFRILFLCRVINSKAFCFDLIDTNFVNWMINAFEDIRYDKEYLSKNGDCIFKALTKLVELYKSKHCVIVVESIAKIEGFINEFGFQKSIFFKDTFIIA